MKRVEIREKGNLDKEWSEWLGSVTSRGQKLDVEWLFMPV